MPDTPPRMDREKLARVERNWKDKDGATWEMVLLAGEDILDRMPWDKYAEGAFHHMANIINAAASAWLDREVESIHKAVIQKLKKAGVGGLARLQVTFAFGEALCSAPGKVDEH